MASAEPKAVNAIVEKLKTQLGENLYSCVLYGSATGSNYIDGVSDINLLIVLNESTPEAQAVIAEAIAGKTRVEPFVLGRHGLERSMCAFAVKFVSIRRNYRLLHGAYPLASVNIDPRILRFLCEQSVRNLRLRLVHAFITFGTDTRRYQAFILRTLSNVFIDISEALRCEGIEVPVAHAERIPILERELAGVDVAILRDLLTLKANPRNISPQEVQAYHAALFALLNHAVNWIERKWPQHLV